MGEDAPCLSQRKTVYTKTSPDGKMVCVGCDAMRWQCLRCSSRIKDLQVLLVKCRMQTRQSI